MNKPFDQLKYIRQSASELAKTASESKEDFGDGDRVSHPKFGEGLGHFRKRRSCDSRFRFRGDQETGPGFCSAEEDLKNLREEERISEIRGKIWETGVFL